MAKTPLQRTAEIEPDPPSKVSFVQVLALFTYHVLLAIFLAYAIYNVWPPQPWPGDTAKARAEAAEEERETAQNRTRSASPSPTVSPASVANVNAATNESSPPAQSSNTAAQSVNAYKVEESAEEPSTAVYDGERPPAFWLFGKKFQPTLEVRLLLLVMLAGAIGSYIHAGSSLVDYVGNRTFVTSWTWWYLLRPFIGMMLALLFYFVFRGGFITAGVNQGGEAAASFINPFGIAAVGGLVGMFSKVAADKLNEVFLTLFAPKQGHGDAKRGDKLISSIKPVITSITPNTGPATGATPVTITGSDFLDKATVNFGGVAASVVTFKDATTLIAVTPPHSAGKVDVEVVNPNALTSVLAGAFTYAGPGGDDAEKGSAPNGGAEKPLHGEGATKT